MTDVEIEIERIRRSFEGGSNPSPRVTFAIESPEFDVHLLAMDELVSRGLMTPHWCLTEKGREWARLTSTQ